MDVKIMPDKAQLGKAAAAAGAEHIRRAIAERGVANIIVATGASQFEMLATLVAEPNINWNVVTGFHLDEYVGLPISHGASFRGYLWQRFVSKLPLPLRAFHFLDAERNPQAECKRVGDILRQHPIDVAFVGIGENGHLAFNDPPADFESEGWFPTFDNVPKQAISMSVRQIMKSRAIICTVPDERKAEAVRNSVEGEVTPKVPASILQRHERCTLYLDGPAAKLLQKSGR
jgi:glucosamine-6-phosphate deaminase